MMTTARVRSTALQPPNPTIHTSESRERLWICMYTPSADGGHARYTHDLLQALASLDDPPLEMSLVTCGDLDSRYRETSYSIHDVLPPIVHRSLYRHRITWAVSRAAYYARRERALLQWTAKGAPPDVIHVQEYTPWLAPRDFHWLRSRNIRVCFTVHNIRPHTYPPLVPSQLYDQLNRHAWRSCDALFVHTSGLGDDLDRFLGPGHPPIFVTPHGLWSGAPSCAVDAELTVAGGTRLLFFGTIRRNKGLHVLLSALRLLPDYSLTIAGAPVDTEYAAQIRAQLAELPNGQVRLLDRFMEDEEIPTLFAEGDLVVLPYTTFAAQSGVLHDALAYRRPVVVTDIGALGESVRGWGVGEVTAPGDATALAQAIRRATEPSNYRAAISALSWVAAELSWEHTARLTASAYRTICAPRRVIPC